MQELADLGVGIAVAKHRQAEGRLGDENVAWNELERNASRIGDILVVARRHDAQPIGHDCDLRRAEHVAGGMEGHGRAAQVHAFAIPDGLRGAGEAFAVTKPHDVERLLRGEHRAMAGTGVVGMTMGDHGLVHRTGGIDMKAAELAAHARRARQQNLLGTHPRQICCKTRNDR